MESYIQSQKTVTRLIQNYPFPISDLEDFPNPEIQNCTRVQVKIQQSDMSYIDSMALSSNNVFYELGSVIKNSIYGYVISSVRLVQQNNVFIRDTSKKYAIKVYFRTKLRELAGKTQEHPLMEITALQFIGNKNPNVLGQVSCLKDEECIYSILDYCSGGELFDIIDLKGPMKSNEARKMILDIINGLKYLQTLGVAHRDMSLENVLYNEETNTYLIIDFGMCLRLKRNPHNEELSKKVIQVHSEIVQQNNSLTKTQFDSILFERDDVLRLLQPVPRNLLSTSTSPYCAIKPRMTCGKKNYIAPEVFKHDTYYNPMLTDIWALGIMLFMVLTGVPPLDSAIPTDQRYNMVINNRLADLVKAWNMNIDPLAVDLIQRILRHNPLDRLTIPEILNHPWILNRSE